MQLIKLWTHEILSNKAFLQFKSFFKINCYFIPSKNIEREKKCTQIFQLTNDLLSLNIDKSLVKSESQQSLPTSVF